MASGTVAPDVRTAWQKCKQGDWEGARADLEAIVAARPDDLEARVCCGRVLAMRRMPEAEGHLRAALAIAPDDAAAVLALAQFLSLERRMAEAAALYRQVLAADPDSLDALLGLAKAQARMGRFEDVCATYRRAIDAHPANAKVCTRFSMFLASHALKWADAAAERDPGAETAVAKATALKMLGRLDEAQSAVQAGLAARPDDPVLHGEAAVLRSLRSGPAQRRRPAIFPRRIQDAAEFEAAIRQGVLPGAAPAEPILSPSSRLVTLGSCFAEHLALTLRGRGVEVHFQKRSEGFDNLYATRFLLDRAMRADQADPTFAVLADKLRAADAVILSLGVSAAYFDRETGEYLPPGLGVDQATLAAGAAFRMLSVEENLGLLRDVVGRFRALRPGVPIVLRCRQSRSPPPSTGPPPCRPTRSRNPPCGWWPTGSWPTAIPASTTGRPTRSSAGSASTPRRSSARCSAPRTRRRGTSPPGWSP